MRYRNRFRRSAAPAVTVKTVFPKRAGKCAGCHGRIDPGTEARQLRLGKKYRATCTGCGRVPVGKKKYHISCLPADVNKAMGFDPNKFQVPNPYAAPQPAAKVAPPPKPPTFEDLALASLLALEKALAFKKIPANKVDEVEKALAKYKNIKARALRPGTPAEGEVATSLAIQQLVKLVFTA
jgi:hypothetical protein